MEGLFTVSGNKNVIVFVLDFFDTKTLDELIEADDTTLDGLDGFTYFHNATSMSIPTAFGIPNLVTGNFFDTDDTTTVSSNDDKITQWFNEHNLLDDAQSQGFSVGVYSDTVYDGYNSDEAPLVDETINIHKIDSIKTNSPLSIIKMLDQCALFRNVPWLLKPLFNYNTDDLNQAVIATDGDDDSTPYIMNDAGYYSELCERGISIDESDTAAYRFIHLTGAHAPYTMDENAEANAELSNQETTVARNRQATGSIKIVKEYLNQLKELGLYEDATIIITADHGDFTWNILPDATATPILLVKPSGSNTGELSVSEAPTGHLDLPATLREAFGMSVDDPTVFEIDESAQRTRYFYWLERYSINGKIDGHGDVGLHEIEIEGNALDFNNWHPTGRFWPNGSAWAEKYAAGELATTNPTTE